MRRRHARIQALLAGSALLSAGVGTSGATTLHVPSQHATIAAALASAAAGDTVLVAPGTYVEDLELPSGVRLLGDGSPESVVIQGSGTTSVVKCQGAASGTRLESLTLRGGAGTLESGTRFGGGLFLRTSSAALRDLVIVECQADVGGGLCAENSAVTWNGGQVADNEATLGGGVFLFRGTHSMSGVAAERNQASAGGAVYLSEVTLLSLDGGVWKENSALTDGGAVFASLSAAVASHCRYEANTAGQSGGAVAIAEGCAIELSHCVLFANQAAVAGGGLHARCDGLPGSGCTEALLSHCDLFRNHAPLAGSVAVDGAARVRVQGSAVAGNDAPPVCLDSRAELTVECTALAANGGSSSSACSIEGTDAVNLDPYLCDLDGGFLERCTNSPLLTTPACAVEPYGALGAGCGACGPTPVEAATWGRLKRRYR